MNAELFKRYAEDVQERFGLSREQMFAKKKQQEYVDARQMLYLLCDRSGMRISYIERYMKEIGHDITHSTIIHGIRRAKKVMYEDDGYKKIISKIEVDAV